MADDFSEELTRRETQLVQTLHDAERFFGNAKALFARCAAGQRPDEPQIERLLAEGRKINRTLQRLAVTIVVDRGHSGPIVGAPHATDGLFIECSWTDAQALHEKVPLKLKQIVSRDVAHFTVALSDAAAETLPRPPYAVSLVG